MGKIIAGILSGVSGKVAGVVGGKWKGKDYLRAYAVPANPNTVKQQTQRNKFTSCVEFAKLILGNILNVMVDPFQKNMSGFNYFIKQNIAFFATPIVWASVKVTFGKLFFGNSAVAPAWAAGDYDLSYDTAAGNNGLGTDHVAAVGYNANTGLIYFSTVSRTRADAGISITMPEGAAGNVIHFWIYAWQLDTDGNIVMVSDSVYQTITV